MLDGALQLAENGSWERIAVGRAWYLGGDKAKGQQIFDGVTGAKNVGRSDWTRLGRVYVEAGEWDKAQAAFDPRSRPTVTTTRAWWSTGRSPI